jgi:tetratricopeptide (TPR) repeat protein
VGLIYLLVASGGTLHFAQSLYPHHVLIADGWLHGRLSVRDEVLRPHREEFFELVHGALERQLASRGARLTESDWEELQARLPAPPVMVDWSVVNGKFYPFWGPMPALLLLPYVALAGLTASDMLISCLLGTATVFVMFLALRQAHHRCLLMASPRLCIALSLLFGLGTVHFYAAVLGQVWFFSQIVTTFFLALAIYLILQTQEGVGWPVASGVAFGAAVLSRTLIIPTIVFFYPALLALSRQRPNSPRRQLVRQALGFSVPMIAAGAIVAAFNYARFGSVFESGTHINLLTAHPILKHRYALHGVFSWYYIPRNFYHYFINPQLLRQSGTNALTFDPEGNSVFLVTPALLYLFRAYRRRDWFVRALWVGAGGSMVALLLLESSGAVQFGNRYLLDLMPLVIFLVAVGMRGRLSPVAAALIALSIAVNAWGTYRFCVEMGQYPAIVAAAATAAQANRADAEYDLASAMETQGNLQEASTHYTEALRWRPEYTEAHINLGNVLRTQGKLDQAVAHYDAAVRLQPTNAEAHNSLAVALAEEQKIEAAIGHFEQAVRLKPDYADAHYNMATVLLGEQRLDEAKAHFTTTLQLHPQHAAAHNNLGFLLFEQGQSADAIAEYRQALQIKPDYPDAHANLGVALAATGQTAEAITHYEAALRLKPDHAAAHRNLGTALARQGHTARAAAELQAALELNPNDSEARQRLEQLQQSAGP